MILEFSHILTPLKQLEGSPDGRGLPDPRPKPTWPWQGGNGRGKTGRGRVKRVKRAIHILLVTAASKNSQPVTNHFGEVQNPPETGHS